MKCARAKLSVVSFDHRFGTKGRLKEWQGSIQAGQESSIVSLEAWELAFGRE